MSRASDHNDFNRAGTAWCKLVAVPGMGARNVDDVDAKVEAVIYGLNCPA